MVNPKGERKKLGDLLIEIGMVDRFQLQRAAQQQKQGGTRLMRAVVDLGFVDEDRLCRALSTALGCETVNLSSMKIHERVLSMLPARLAVRHGALPIAIKRANQTDYLYLVMADPLDADAVEELERVTGCKTNVLIAPPTQLDAALEKYYRPAGASTSTADTSSPQLSGSAAPTQRPADPARSGAQPPPSSTGARVGRATASLNAPPPPSLTGSAQAPAASQASRSAVAPAPSLLPTRPTSAQSSANVPPARAAQTVISPPPAQAAPPPSSRPTVQTMSGKAPKPRAPSPPPAARPPAQAQARGGAPAPQSARASGTSQQLNGGSSRAPRAGSSLGDALPPLTLPRGGSDLVRTHIEPKALEVDDAPAVQLRIFDSPSEPEAPPAKLQDPSEAPQGFALPQIAPNHEWEDGQTLDVGMDEISPDVAALLAEAGIQPTRGQQLPRIDHKEDAAIHEPQTAEVDLLAPGLENVRRAAGAQAREELEAPWLPEVEPDAILGKATPRSTAQSAGAQSARSPAPVPAGGGLFAPPLPQGDLLESGDLGDPPLVSEASHSETELESSLFPPLPSRKPSAPPASPVPFVHALELPVDIGSAPSPFDVFRNVDLRAGLDRTGIIPAIDWDREEFVPPPFSTPGPAPDGTDQHLVGIDDIPSSPAAVRARAAQPKKEEEPAQRKNRTAAPARRPAPAPVPVEPAPALKEAPPAAKETAPQAPLDARTLPAPGPSSVPPPPSQTPAAKEPPPRARRKAPGQHEDEPTNPRIARAAVREALVESAEPTPTPASPDAVDRAQVMAELEDALPPRGDTVLSQPREAVLEPEIIPLRAEDAEELEPLPEPAPVAAKGAPKVDHPLVRALVAGDSLNSADRAQLVLALGRLMIKKGLITEDELAAALSTD